MNLCIHVSMYKYMHTYMHTYAYTHGRREQLAAPLVDDDGQVTGEVDLHLRPALRHLLHADLNLVRKQSGRLVLAARAAMIRRRAGSGRAGERGRRAGAGGCGQVRALSRRRACTPDACALCHVLLELLHVLAAHHRAPLKLDLFLEHGCGTPPRGGAPCAGGAFQGAGARASAHAQSTNSQTVQVSVSRDPAESPRCSHAKPLEEGLRPPVRRCSRPAPSRRRRRTAFGL